jgi:FkbM family methyltransferase
MRAWVVNIILWITDQIAKLTGSNRLGRYFQDRVIRTARDNVTEVNHEGFTLLLSTPTELCRWRASTFSSKEPETLRWIDQMPSGSKLWDVGANIGLYSLYAAKHRQCQVWAFEPSVFNLEVLARNVALNSLSAQVCIVPLALSDKAGSSNLRLSSTEWGGALSTFDKDFGWDGNPIQEIFAFQTLGLSMDDAVGRLELPAPDYLKIDVDGIEHLILAGGEQMLADVTGVLVEINTDFKIQESQIMELLGTSGFVLEEQEHSSLIEESSTFSMLYNQVWSRP